MKDDPVIETRNGMEDFRNGVALMQKGLEKMFNDLWTTTETMFETSFRKLSDSSWVNLATQTSEPRQVS